MSCIHFKGKRNYKWIFKSVLKPKSAENKSYTHSFQNQPFTASISTSITISLNRPLGEMKQTDLGWFQSSTSMLSPGGRPHVPGDTCVTQALCAPSPWPVYCPLPGQAGQGPLHTPPAHACPLLSLLHSPEQEILHCWEPVPLQALRASISCPGMLGRS